MVMIRLFKSDATDFSLSNGEYILHPTKCEIFKEDNGDYYCDLTDSIDMLSWYVSGNIVIVPTRWGEQGFRLRNPIVRNHKVECRAFHLSYDAQNYVVLDSYAVDMNCNQALNYFLNAMDVENTPFTLSSDITGILSTRVVRKSLLEIIQWLASAEKYNGHIHRDNWHIEINTSIGEDRQVVLSKAIKDIEVSENWDNVCTKLFPYTTDGEIAITLDDFLYSPNQYDTPYTRIIEFANELNKDDYETEEAFITATKQWLQAKGVEYLEENSVPKVNYKVSAVMNNISDVGDVILVKHPSYEITTNVISLTYDAITDRYISMEFGNFKKELKNLVDTIKVETKKETETIVEQSTNYMASQLKDATNRISSVLNDSYVIYEGHQILVVDALPKENAQKVIRINREGIGYSQNGISGTFNSAWLIDGTLDMQKINVINLVADFIKGGTLELGGNGTIGDSSGAITIKDEHNNILATLNRQGIKVFASNGDYVLMNAEVGFSGYTKDNTRVYWADGETFHMKSAEIEDKVKIASMVQIVPVNTSSDKGIGFVALGGGS